MISLKQSLSDLDQIEELYRTSLQCYISAVGGIESHQVEAGRELLGEYRRQLKDLRRKVMSGPAVATLPRSSVELAGVLKRYAEQAGGFFLQKQVEIQRCLIPPARSPGCSRATLSAFLNPLPVSTHDPAVAGRWGGQRCAPVRASATLSGRVTLCRTPSRFRRVLDPAARASGAASPAQ